MSESPCEKCSIREDKDYPCAATEHDQQDCVRACSWKEGYAKGEKAVKDELVGMVVGGEIDALRAEVEVLRRALKWTARRADELAAYRPGDSCPLEPAERPDPCPENDECWQCLATRAISEARKGGEG